MSPHQQKFLADECFSMTLMAAVQRANVYRKGSSERVRNRFRRALRGHLEQLAKSYSQSVSETNHLNNIGRLADNLSQSHPDALVKGRFRIGCAQKALNLYLKYMWCLGNIPSPPHCPFDYQIISRLLGCKDLTWTELDSICDYKRLVAAARAQAGSILLAEWELKLYNDAQPRVQADAPKAARRSTQTLGGNSKCPA